MEHSKLLGIGRYFHEWATVVRIDKTVNLNLKFKVIHLFNSSISKNLRN